MTLLNNRSMAQSSYTFLIRFLISLYEFIRKYYNEVIYSVEKSARIRKFCKVEKIEVYKNMLNFLKI